MRHSRGRPLWWHWAWASALLFAWMTLWSLQSAVPSGPDEPANLIKAAAVAHGTLIGRPIPLGAAWTEVKVPDVVFQTGLPGQRCHYDRSTRPAGCAPALKSGSAEDEAWTYLGRYPPLYYGLTGLPTLVSGSPAVLRAMRGVASLLSAVVLGLGLAVAIRWSRSTWFAAGIAVAVTPQVIYMGGVVNANGLEIAAALTAWIAGAVLVFEQAADPPREVVWAFAAALALLATCRALSPLYVALIAGSLALMRPAAARNLINRPKVRNAAIAVAAVTAVSSLFVLLARSYEVESFPLPHITFLGLAVKIASDTELFLRQAVGAYGSPDTNAPWPTVVLVAEGLLYLLAVALGGAIRRDRRRLGALTVLLLFAIPYLLVLSHAKTNGIAWQGRYGLPLYAGVPLLSAALCDLYGPRLPKRVFDAGLAAVAAAQILAGYWLLRRYTVGIGGEWNPWASVRFHWIPPVPIAVALVADLALPVLWILLLRGWASPRGADATPAATVPVA